MIVGRPLAKVVGLVTGILAFATVAVLAFFYINAKFGFVSGEALISLTRTKNIMVLLTVGLTGLQFALKRNVIIFILYLILAGVAFGFIVAAGGVGLI